jgi:threonine/homoserine/homoserine lactone efflux protein
MSRFAHTDYILGIISFGGSIFLIYLGYESLSYRAIDPDPANQVSVIKKGIIANFLNPSPYVFWFTIGAPTIIKAYNKSLIDAGLFIAVFYFVLIGSKVVIAVITGKSKQFLSSRFYLYLVRFLGVVLFLFAIYFIENSLRYFKIL